MGSDSEDPVSQVGHVDSVKPGCLEPGSELDLCFLGTV